MIMNTNVCWIPGWDQNPAYLKDTYVAAFWVSSHAQRDLV
jgi:hypothetical protein